MSFRKYVGLAGGPPKRRLTEKTSSLMGKHRPLWRGGSRGRGCFRCGPFFPVPQTIRLKLVFRFRNRKGRVLAARRRGQRNRQGQQAAVPGLSRRPQGPVSAVIPRLPLRDVQGTARVQIRQKRGFRMAWRGRSRFRLDRLVQQPGLPLRSQGQTTGLRYDRGFHVHHLR